MSRTRILFEKQTVSVQKCLHFYYARTFLERMYIPILHTYSKVSKKQMPFFLVCDRNLDKDTYTLRYVEPDEFMQATIKDNEDWVELRSATCRIEQVNGREILKEHIYVKRLVIPTDIAFPLTAIPLLYYVFEEVPNLEYVMLGNVLGITDQSFEFALWNVPHLKHVEFVHTEDSFNYNRLNSLLRQCRSMQRITIWNWKGGRVGNTRLEGQPLVLCGRLELVTVRLFFILISILKGTFAALIHIIGTLMLFDM